MKTRSRQGIGLGIGWVIGIMLTAGWARGGDLDSPAAPDQAASAMYTLNDLYNKLDTRAPAVKRGAAFVEPTAGPTGGTMRTLNEIMAMTETRPPVTRTGQTTSYGTGSDGNVKSGGAWPNPRFTDNDDGTVTDNLTGLVWAKNANLPAGPRSWADALDYCNAMNSGSGTYGYTDWRLPNRNELQSLHGYYWASPVLPNTAGTARWSEGNPFTGVMYQSPSNQRYYWSSSTRMGSTGYAWYVDMREGIVNYADKTDAANYLVWPVRGPQ